MIAYTLPECGDGTLSLGVGSRSMPLQTKIVLGFGDAAESLIVDEPVTQVSKRLSDAKKGEAEPFVMFKIQHHREIHVAADRVLYLESLGR
jgi:hypothetical protein